jgi:hypothetical protein
MPTASPHSAARFVGDWNLVPAKSHFELGRPPVSAEYIISIQDNQLVFTVRYTTSSGSQHEQTNLAVLDGQPHLYENPEVADTITHTLVNDTTIDSVVRTAGTIISHIRREASADNRVLTITQFEHLADGTQARNVSIYERVGEMPLFSSLGEAL